MILELIRRKLTEKTTQGVLYSDQKFLCWTLEDKWRDLLVEPKIPGETCIPEGHYRVVLDRSDRFRRIMPYIIDVPHFTGILLHPGNTHADTKGCILVGLSRSEDYIGLSRIAFSRLMFQVWDADQKQEEIWLTITKELFDGSPS